MESRSAFYVELNSNWCVVVIYDFVKFKNCLISRLCAKIDRCQGNLKFHQGFVTEMSENFVSA